MDSAKEAEAKLADCLVTFADPPDDPWLGRKISKEAWNLLENSPDPVMNAYVSFTPLQIKNPVDTAVETEWLYPELFEAGLMDYYDVRALAFDDYRQTLEDRFLAVREDLENVPDLTIERVMGPMVLVRLSLLSIQELEALPFVHFIYVDDPDAKPGVDVTTYYSMESMQIDEPYFVTANGGSGYDGEAPSYADGNRQLVAGIVDWNGFNASHHAFWDLTNGTSRVVKAYDCNNYSCSEVSPATSMNVDGDNHGNLVAGALLADLRDEQDNNTYPSNQPAEQQKRSGVAPEANAIFYNANSGGSGSNPIVEALFTAGWTSGNHPDIFSTSSYSGSNDCTGTNSTAGWMNTNFLAGLLSMAAAGNDNHYGACNVRPTASASGTMAIGGIGDSNLDSAADWNGADLWDWGEGDLGTALGGYTYYGAKHESIIDLVTVVCTSHYLNDVADSGADAYSDETQCGTSISQPFASGALLDFIDMRLAQGSSYIRMPGIQKVSMINMGSRHNAVNSQRTYGFNDVWGGGRMKMRRLDADGLADSYEYQITYICVSQGQNYYWYPNGGTALPADVASFKAALWYFTDQTDYANANDVDLYLQYESSPGTWTTLKSDTSSDFKKMVYYDNVASRKVRLNFVGTDVNDNQGDVGDCGANQARVYFSYVYEDDDRTGLPGSTIAQQ